MIPFKEITIMKVLLFCLMFIVLILCMIYMILRIMSTVKQLPKPKKKTKTNETKIRLKVKYTLRDHPTITSTQFFVSNKNLMYCVRDAIVYAKNYNYIIHKMYVLTTEE